MAGGREKNRIIINYRYRRQNTGRRTYRAIDLSSNALARYFFLVFFALWIRPKMHFVLFMIRMPNNRLHIFAYLPDTGVMNARFHDFIVPMFSTSELPLNVFSMEYFRVVPSSVPSLKFLRDLS